MKKGGKSWELTLCLWICREKKTFVRQLLVNCPSPASVFPKLGQFGTASHWLFIAHDQLCKFVQVIKFWHVKMSHNLEPRKVAIPPNIFTYLGISIETDATRISTPASGTSSCIKTFRYRTAWVPFFGYLRSSGINIFVYSGIGINTCQTVWHLNLQMWKGINLAHPHRRRWWGTTCTVYSIVRPAYKRWIGIHPRCRWSAGNWEGQRDAFCKSSLL
jgi:hypothetical protein